MVARKAAGLSVSITHNRSLWLTEVAAAALYEQRLVADRCRYSRKLMTNCKVVLVHPVVV
jgi:hypothetical protein